MGLLGLFKKKPKKDYATLDDVKPAPEEVEVSDKPLKRSEIREIGFEEEPEEASAPAEPESGSGGFGMFGMGADSEETSESSEESGTSLKLEEAMQQARKYLIVHAQIPNDLLPKKSSKRENGTFYFEFQDRELNRIELDGNGEVIDWEREKL